MKSKNVVIYFAVATALGLSGGTIASAAAVPVPLAPTELNARWAGHTVAGTLDGVVLTWDLSSGATSYDIYRGIQVAPNKAGDPVLIARVTGGRFYNPGIMPVAGTATFYEVAAVNASGESPKTAPVDAAALPSLQSVLQGTIISITSKGIAVVQIPAFAPPCGDTACPDYILAPQDFLVDFNGVVYEDPDGTPVPPFLLSAGDSVVLKGIRVPTPAESTLPAVQATIVEMAVPSTASSTATN